ncbi:MAG TPA: type II toxin-antitoxin system VapC family toxin [Elusimicrobiota bacterium]|jgi:tRNA(fMet)-specific endonuclease VapC|nr:type II toxin-antitoxin system VapC family toxin [Elusimicrobiota bacterium]
MKLLLDTNAYREAADGKPRTVELLRRADEIYVPFVVLGELRAGFATGTVGKKNAAKLTEFLGSPRVRVLFADEQTTHSHAALFAQLRRQGTPIPTNDLWIAALAIQHDLPLLTSDRHFSHLPQLLIL